MGVDRGAVGVEPGVRTGQTGHFGCRTLAGGEQERSPGAACRGGGDRVAVAAAASPGGRGFWSWADFPGSQTRLRLPPGGHSLQSSAQKAVLGPVTPQDQWMR